MQLISYPATPKLAATAAAQLIILIFPKHSWKYLQQVIFQSSQFNSNKLSLLLQLKSNKTPEKPVFSAEKLLFLVFSALKAAKKVFFDLEVRESLLCWVMQPAVTF